MWWNLLPLNLQASMCSKTYMAQPEVGCKFDEAWTHAKLLELGRSADPDSFAPAARVVTTAHKDVLDEQALAMLETKWARDALCLYTHEMPLLLLLNASW